MKVILPILPILAVALYRAENEAPDKVESKIGVEERREHLTVPSSLRGFIIAKSDFER